MKKHLICVICCLALCIFICTCAEEAEVSESPSAEPIHITTPGELAAMEPNGNYVLDCNLDMCCTEWVPIEFNGTLDGQGHTIYNLTVTQKSDLSYTTIDGNHKNYYNSELVGLFSVTRGAHIANLNIVGAYLEYTTNNSCMASIVAAISEDSVFENLYVSGRVYLYTGGRMSGVAGIVGFGTGKILECSADLTLVYVDTNPNYKCEEFLGGANSCGYMDIIDFNVHIDGYASVHGYCHNGGVVGMHHNHDANYKKNTISGCVASGQITFFEDNSDRRAYCKSIVGEKLNNSLTLSDNNGDNFTSNEVKNYKVNLLPEMCEEPDIIVSVVEPTDNDAGYEIHSCTKCGCTYLTNYMLPLNDLQD